MKHSHFGHGKTNGYRRYQRGASLLEGVAFLGIAAIVILGAISLLSTAFTGAQSNRAMEEITALRTAAKKLYTGQTYPANGMLATLINANAIPGTLAVDAANSLVTNSWGDTVDVTGNTGSFTITYRSVPKDACYNIVSGASGWKQVDDGGNNSVTTFPVAANDATTICGSDANTINFTAG